jgi:signal transduction histidine kinase
MSRDAVRHVAFALAFLLSGLLGRTTIYERTDVSLVWPAAGVAVLWWLSTRWAHRWWLTVPIFVLSFVVNRVTGADTPLALVFGVTNTMQVAMVSELLTHRRLRWSPVTWHGRFDTTAHLVRVGFSAVAGTLVPAALGVTALWQLRDFATIASALTWWGRNAVGCIGVVTAVLLVMDAVRHREAALRPVRPRSPGAVVEATALVVATVVLVVVDITQRVPLSFFLPALTVWAGIRFPPVVAGVHSLLAGVAAVTLTLVGEGPFAMVEDPHQAILLSQTFVGITVLTGCYLALARAENDALTDQLRAERESLAGYARTAAHDLLNPLTAIRGWIEIIADTPPGSAPDRIAVQRASSAAARMQALVRDLLVDAQSHEIALKSEVVDMDKLALHAAEIHPTVDVTVVEPIPDVLGDPGMLEQVLANLIGNAVKYADPERDPEITVMGFQRDKDTVVVRVCDRGIGIPEDLRRNVFESFTRVPGTAREGTGLGLAICKRIVERHGGRICACGRADGPGTIIEMTLPAARG